MKALNAVTIGSADRAAVCAISVWIGPCSRCSSSDSCCWIADVSAVESGTVSSGSRRKNDLKAFVVASRASVVAWVWLDNRMACRRNLQRLFEGEEEKKGGIF